jgi:hypothetical protein
MRTSRHKITKCSDTFPPIPGFLLRGPYLARFELCSKLVKRNVDASDVLGETIELFIEYFRKFGHKPCCVSDLRLYLNLLDGEKKAELSSRLIKDVGISSTSVPQSVNTLSWPSSLVSICH